MLEINHNTHRVKDGAYMKMPKQQIGSFVKYLSDALKGIGQKELSPMVDSSRGKKFASVFNGFIHVAPLGVDNKYRVSWTYKAGRGGIAEGTKDVLRVATIKVEQGVDLVDYLDNILDNPQPIYISVKNPV